MIRTQVYLTQHQRDELAAMARMAGKSRSGLIREALDQFIDQQVCKHREAVLKEAAGMWKDRDDLPDFEAIHGSWDRG